MLRRGLRSQFNRGYQRDVDDGKFLPLRVDDCGSAPLAHNHEIRMRDRNQRSIGQPQQKRLERLRVQRALDGIFRHAGSLRHRSRKDKPLGSGRGAAHRHAQARPLPAHRPRTAGGWARWELTAMRQITGT